MNRNGERGSAMLLAILVSVILTLLGVSFLMMAQTENLIAQNELRAAQALYAAEAGARAAKRWFDRPGQASPVDFPRPSEIDRSLRIIDDDGEGPNAPVAAPAGQLYKDGVDRDGDTVDDLFRPPYRGDVKDALLGTAAGPDIRITDATFLDALSRRLFDDFPDESAGVVARITEVDVYGPPYLETLGGWARFGIGTVRVTAQILDDGAVLAERTVRAVLNEAPYRGPYGPLHSGAGLTFQRTPAGRPTVHWGPLTAMDTVIIDGDVEGGSPMTPRSLPRSPSGLPQLDPFWGFAGPLSDYKSALGTGTDLGDPWFRVMTAGLIHTGGDRGQPLPSPWRTWSPPATEPDKVDYSNLLQKGFVVFPRYDYQTWKTIAAGGDVNVRYFAHAGGQNFRENGRGPAASFRSLTHGQRGLYFFDTADGRPPEDDGSNLTPPIVIAGGNWEFTGLLFLNAEKFQTKNVQGVDVAMLAPGEPFEDRNQNGVHEAPGEGWIDILYPPNLLEPFRSGGDSTRNPTAPLAVTARASLRGILYTTGKFEATGQSRHYGSIMAERGVVQEDGSATGYPEIYYDASIVNDWPKPATGLPRVVITRWITDS